MIRRLRTVVVARTRKKNSSLADIVVYVLDRIGWGPFFSARRNETAPQHHAYILRWTRAIPSVFDAATLGPTGPYHCDTTGLRRAFCSFLAVVCLTGNNYNLVGTS